MTELDRMTYSEFVSSKFVETAISRSLYRYMAKFLAIMDKAVIKDSQIALNETAGRIMRTRSWNWAAFFLGLFWLAYRGVPQWKWLTVIFCISTVTIVEPGLDRISSFLWFGVNIAIGILGNQYLFLHLRNSLLKGIDAEQLKPSWLRVVIVFAAILISMALVAVGAEMLGVGTAVEN